MRMKIDKEIKAANDSRHSDYSTMIEFCDLSCEFEGCESSATQVGIGDREDFVYFLCEKHSEYALKNEVGVEIYPPTNEINVYVK